MVTQHYSFRCDCAGCETEHVDVTPLNRQVPQPLDAWPPKPQLPPGWRLVDEHLVCPQHTLALDGRPTSYGTFMLPVPGGP